jgi:hypothetical protein
LVGILQIILTRGAGSTGGVERDATALHARSRLPPARDGSNQWEKMKMTRTMVCGLAIAAVLSLAAGGLMPSNEASAAEKGKPTGTGLLGWATFPPYSNQPHAQLRSIARKAKGKGSSSTYLRMSQPPAGASPQFEGQIDSMMNNNLLSQRSKKSKGLRAKGGK